MVAKEKITGIILAGGKSSRMGTDKAMLSFNGKKLIEYSIALMKEVSDNQLISANNDAYRAFEIPVVPDNFQGIGPLAGIEAGLRFSQNRINLFAPCDTPFLNAELLLKILSNIESYDAVVPVSKDGKIEPLTGFYSKEALPALTKQIDRGDFKIQNLLQIIHTKYILIDDIKLIKNINTPEDLKNIEQKDKKQSH